MTHARGVAFWLSVQVLVVLAAAVPFVLPERRPADVLELTTATTSFGERVAMPDDWRLRGARDTRVVYSFGVELAERPGEPWALLIDSVRMRAEPALNGEPLVALDKRAETARRMWFRPLLYSVPAGLLHGGANELTVTLEAEPGRGYLAAPLVGPLRSLAPAARIRERWRPTLLALIVVGMVAVGAFMLLLWTQRRSEAIYGLYGLGILAWAAHNAMLLVDPLLPVRIWDGLSHLTLGLFIAATTYFIVRFLGERRPYLERAVVWFVAAGGTLLLTLPTTLQRAFSEYIWHPVILSVGFYLYVLTYAAAWRRADRALQLLAMTGSIMVLYGAHDALIILGMTPWNIGYFLPYSAAPSLIAFTTLLVRRFAQSLNDLELMARDLDSRVRAAAGEIEANHARLRDLERQQSLAEERERVARDIHDGVGSQLVALLARLKRGSFDPEDARASLSNALHDLRLVIESLDASEGDLGTALAMWRHRLEPRLAGAAVRLHWQPADTLRIEGLGPSDILSVLRLLDEAATNALRHARARTLTVAYGMDESNAWVTLSDDGHGGAREGGRGHGLKNMRKRATALGATLEIHSDASGTRVALRIPRHVRRSKTDEG